MDRKQVTVGDISAVSGEISIAGGNIYKGYTAEEVSTLLAQIESAFQAKKFDGGCPYKGLDVFEEEDAELFFGRKKSVDDLASRVKESRTVFITGPSGSGKSSLVRAGLIPALKKGAIKGSKGWLYETIKPGRDPLESLALVFSRLKSPKLATYFREHIHEAGVLNECTESTLSGRKDQRLVLFIDQFEEIFSQVNQKHAGTFINLLTDAANVEDGRVCILFAMRSDFVSNCATYPKLNALLNQQFVQIGAMQPDELVSAIAQPALRVGLKIDPDLIAQIINDMQGEPGVLPLMQFALKDLFDAEQARGGVMALTLNEYLARGGIHKALERHADDAFSRLSASEQELARSIFSGLIEVGRGTQDTKRTALFDELVPTDIKADELKTVVQKLTDARLITTDEQAGKDTVAISHEKLIDAWPWLKKLVNENRDEIALQNEIADDAKEWEEHKRDNSYLYTGARLANAVEKLEGRKLSLGGLAQKYIVAGRARWRRGQIVLFSGISAIIALLIIAVVIFAQLANEARRQTNIALARQLAAQSQAILAILPKEQFSHHPELSLLLAIESMKTSKKATGSYLPAAEQALRDALSQIKLGGHPLYGTGEPALASTFSPDGNWLAVSYLGGNVYIWDVRKYDLRPAIVLSTKSDAWIQMLKFSRDGRWLATELGTWDTKDPSKEPLSLQGKDSILSFDFSPDGRWQAIGTVSSSDETTRISVWDMKNIPAKPVVLYEGNGKLSNLTFSPHEEWLAAASSGEKNVILLWNIQSAFKEILTLQYTGDINQLSFSPEDRWIVIAGNTGIVRWDLQNISAGPERIQTIEGKGDFSGYGALAFSNDGNRLVTDKGVWDLKDSTQKPVFIDSYEKISTNGDWLATSDGCFIHLYDIAHGVSADPIILHGHEMVNCGLVPNGNLINSLSLDPNGRWLASTDMDSVTWVWDLENISTEPTVLPVGGGISDLAFSPDGHWLGAGGDEEHVVRLWDMQNLSTKAVVSLQDEDRMIFSPAGQWLATMKLSEDRNFKVTLRNLQNPSEDFFVPENETGINTLAFSPDEHWLAIGNMKDSIHVMDIENPSRKSMSLQGADFANQPVFSQSGRWLAAIGGESANQVDLWDTENFSLRQIKLPKGISEIRISFDDHWLVASVPEKGIYVVDLNGSSKEASNLFYFEDSHPSCIAFSPPYGRWLAAGDSSGVIRLWDLRNFEAAPFVIKVSRDPVSHLVFSKDGQNLMVGYLGGSIYRWNMQDISEEPVVIKNPNLLGGIAISPDGKWLATGDPSETMFDAGRDRAVRLWHLDLNELLAIACKLVGRNFTQTEWTQYFPNEEYRATCPQWPLESEAIPTP